MYLLQVLHAHFDSVLCGTSPGIGTFPIVCVLGKHHLERVVNLRQVVSYLRKSKHQAFGAAFAQHPLQWIERQSVILCGPSHVEMCSEEPSLDDAALQELGLCLTITRKHIFRLHIPSILIQSYRMTKMLYRVVE